MTSYHLTVILLTLFGFLLVAYLLLAPVYRFLKREEEASRHWTKEALAKRLQEQPPKANGHSAKQEDDRPKTTE